MNGEHTQHVVDSLVAWIKCGLIKFKLLGSAYLLVVYNFAFHGRKFIKMIERDFTIIEIIELKRPLHIRRWGNHACTLYSANFFVYILPRVPVGLVISTSSSSSLQFSWGTDVWHPALRHLSSIVLISNTHGEFIKLSYISHNNWAHAIVLNRISIAHSP